MADDIMPSPKKVKFWSWIATGVAVVVILSADYGPEPHVLSGVQNKLKEIKSWVLKPSSKDVEEFRLKYRLQLGKTSIEPASTGERPDSDTE